MALGNYLTSLSLGFFSEPEMIKIPLSGTIRIQCDPVCHLLSSLSGLISRS